MSRADLTGTYRRTAVEDCALGFPFANIVVVKDISHAKELMGLMWRTGDVRFSLELDDVRTRPPSRMPDVGHLICTDLHLCDQRSTWSPGSFILHRIQSVQATFRSSAIGSLDLPPSSSSTNLLVGPAIPLFAHTHPKTALGTRCRFPHLYRHQVQSLSRLVKESLQGDLVDGSCLLAQLRR